MTEWKDQKKVLRVLGHNSQVVKNEIMKDVKRNHVVATPDVNELLFTVAKTKDELKKLMTVKSASRGIKMICEAWDDPKSNTHCVMFMCRWTGRGIDKELLR